MKAGLPASPRQMAQTILDFPVPLGPTIMFKLGPGDTSQASYVLNYKHVKLLNRDKSVPFTSYHLLSSSLHHLQHLKFLSNPAQGRLQSTMRNSVKEMRK